MDYRTAAEDIRTMRIRGAGRIARTGASALGDLAREFKGDDLGAFLDEVGRAKKVLLDSRPTAVSLWNGVHSAVRGLSACSRSVQSDSPLTAECTPRSSSRTPTWRSRRSPG